MLSYLNIELSPPLRRLNTATLVLCYLNPVTSNTSLPQLLPSPLLQENLPKPAHLPASAQYQFPFNQCQTNSNPILISVGPFPVVITYDMKAPRVCAIIV